MFPWIYRFVIPERITTDQDRHLEREIFLAMSEYFWIWMKTTTAYHLQSKGLIDKQPRTLKESWKCHLEKSIVLLLPIVLLGLRTAVKEDLGFSAAELTYNSASYLPGELFSPPSTLSHPYFVYKLQATVRHLKSLPKSTHGWRAIVVSGQLISYFYTFIHSAHVTL